MCVVIVQLVLLTLLVRSADAEFKALEQREAKNDIQAKTHQTKKREL